MGVSSFLFVIKELGQLQSLYTAPELVGRLAHLVGIIPECEPVRPGQLLPQFSIPSLSTTISSFDKVFQHPGP